MEILQVLKENSEIQNFKIFVKTKKSWKVIKDSKKQKIKYDDE